MTGLQACPICSCQFPPETNNREINEHIDQVCLPNDLDSIRFLLWLYTMSHFLYNVLAVLFRRCVSLLLVFTGN